MALRLHHVVLSGELINTEHYSTHGWLELRGRDSPLLLQLTGNCGPGLAGCHLRFTARPTSQEKLSGVADGMPQDAPDIEWLAGQQVGPTADMLIRDVKWFDCPVGEFYLRSKLGEPLPTVIKKSLYLEWYSQNGRVVLELVDPEMEFVQRGTINTPAPGAHLVTDGPPAQTESTSNASTNDAEVETDRTDLFNDDLFIDELDPPQTGLGVTFIGLDEDSGNTTIEEQFYPHAIPREQAAEELDADAIDDLQRHLDQQADAIERSLKFDCHDDDKDESLRELELMDELLERRTGDWMSDLVDHPEKLPQPSDVADDQAEGLLKSILAQLALYGVSIHVCKHFTPKETYAGCWKTFFRKN